ncbi:hypothetical protein JaAD80_19330 [Janthinobacterium sp. AD80]|nr:hypothetical protein JaAD80_19330 [Janthinobacterium sp. AD80]
MGFVGKVARIARVHQEGLTDKVYKRGSECSGLMYPDTNLGENARHGEVFDEQAKTYIFP